MEAVAKLKNCPMSARKMRLVVNNIRNVEVSKALDILKFTRREAATWLEKLVLSAVANWEQKTGQDPDEYELYIKEARVDEAPMLKRYRPAPYGRAHRIRKRSNHVTIIVENRVYLEDEDVIVEEIDEIVDTQVEAGNELIEDVTDTIEDTTVEDETANTKATESDAKKENQED